MQPRVIWLITLSLALNPIALSRAWIAQFKTLFRSLPGREGGRVNITEGFDNYSALWGHITSVKIVLVPLPVLIR